MQYYSLQFFDRSDLLIDSCMSQADDLGQAMGEAHQQIDACFRVGEAKPLDARGWVDVLDVSGRVVGRVYCAEAIVALT